MGHAQCVEVLLEVGVRVNVKDVDGGTPMAYARQSGNTGRFNNCVSVCVCDRVGIVEGVYG